MNTPLHELDSQQGHCTKRTLCNIRQQVPHSILFNVRTGQLKCDVTRAETRFRLSAKRASPFKSAGASVQSTAGSRVVRISGSNAGYTMFRGSVKGTGYPLHSPVSPSLSLPCVKVCHHISTAVYPNFFSSFSNSPHRCLWRVMCTSSAVICVVQTVVQLCCRQRLEVNTEKTYHVFISHEHNTRQNHDIKAANKSFENLAKYKYLGMTPPDQSRVRETIKTTLTLWRRNYLF